MTMPEATQIAFRDEVRRLAAEKPEFVYPKRADAGQLIRCMYVNEAGTGGDCIIGQALINTGLMSPGQLSYLEGKSAQAILRNLGAPGTLAMWANRVQRGQDFELPWGLAAQEADALYSPQPVAPPLVAPLPDFIKDLLEEANATKPAKMFQ